MSEELEPRKKDFMRSLEQLRPDLFLPENWTKRQKDEVLEEVRSERTRHSLLTSIPMNCKASKCKFADTCPLQQRGIAPKGSPCPIELEIIQQFMRDYMEELHVDPENIVEVAMVRDLVNQEIQYLRATKVLAQEHFVQENIVGIDENTGEPLLRPELHVAVEFEDKLLKRKTQLRKEMMASRNEKAKLGQGKVDTSQLISEIIEQVSEVDRKREELIKRKMGIQAIDSYVDEDFDVMDAEVIEDEDDNDGNRSG